MAGNQQRLETSLTSIEWLTDLRFARNMQAAKQPQKQSQNSRRSSNIIIPTAAPYPITATTMDNGNESSGGHLSIPNTSPQTTTTTASSTLFPLIMPQGHHQKHHHQGQPSYRFDGGQGNEDLVLSPNIMSLQFDERINLDSPAIDLNRTSVTIDSNSPSATTNTLLDDVKQPHPTTTTTAMIQHPQTGIAATYRPSEQYILASTFPTQYSPNFNNDNLINGGNTSATPLITDDAMNQAMLNAQVELYLAGITKKIEAERVNITQRPTFSYATLTAVAIKQSPKEMLTLTEIYDWIMETFPYYQRAGATWKNSIRHNLSFSKLFKRVSSEGRGNHWMLDPEQSAQLLHYLSDKRRPYSRRHRKASAAKYALDETVDGQHQQQQEPQLPGPSSNSSLGITYSLSQFNNGYGGMAVSDGGESTVSNTNSTLTLPANSQQSLAVAAVVGPEGVGRGNEPTSNYVIFSNNRDSKTTTQSVPRHQQKLQGNSLLKDLPTAMGLPGNLLMHQAAVPVGIGGGGGFDQSTWHPFNPQDPQTAAMEGVVGDQLSKSAVGFLLQAMQPVNTTATTSVGPTSSHFGKHGSEDEEEAFDYDQLI